MAAFLYFLQNMNNGTQKNNNNGRKHKIMVKKYENAVISVI